MIKVVASAGESIAVRDDILAIGSWQVGAASQVKDRDFESFATFADGTVANNKLLADLVLATYEEYASEVPEDRRITPEDLEAVRERVLTSYDSLLDAYDEQPDTLWGVPTGGQDYAIARAERKGLKVVRLAKVDTTPNQKTFRPATPRDIELLAKAECMVGSEDAGSQGASPFGAMFDSDDYGLAALREKTIGLDYVWVRGTLSRLPDTLPIHTIVRESIPVQISRQDAFYQRFGHLAFEHQVKV